MAEPQPTQDTQIDGGYIVLARQILESDIFSWKPPEWLKIWIYILLKVQYQNGRHFARGTGYFNWEEDKRNLKGITKYQWYHCIEFLRKERMVATRKTIRGNIIKVLKYEIYQDSKLYKTTINKEANQGQPFLLSKTSKLARRKANRKNISKLVDSTITEIPFGLKSETKSEAVAKQERSTSEAGIRKPNGDGTLRTSKKLKKERKKEYKHTPVKIFSFWKEHLNHPKALLTKDRRIKIAARLKEGYTIEQSKEAIKGCKLSAYHMGDNPQGKVYDTIELIFRNGDKIEQFINIYKEVLKHGKTGKRDKRDTRAGWEESEKYRRLYRK